VVRGQSGLLSVVNANAIYTWPEHRRIWRVVFPPSMKQAAARRKLQGFATYRS
jgi:hypothetical protein